MSPAEGGRVVAAEADRLERLVFDLLDLARLGRAGFAVDHGRSTWPRIGAPPSSATCRGRRSWAWR